MSPLPLLDALQRLAAIAREAPPPGQAPVLVGGAVRDALEGRPIVDADVAVAGDVAAFAQAAAARIDSHAVPLDDRVGLIRLPCDGGHIDLTRMAGPDGGDLDADLARRDFTIDALAVPLALLPADLGQLDPSVVIDRHGGLADLRARRIRDTGPGVIAADPLRALRGARLAAELRFDIEPETQVRMRANAAGLDAVAPERVGTELARLFAQTDAARGVGLMEATGLLSVCFPELDAGRGCEQRPHHAFDVFTHSLTASRLIDVLLRPDAPDEPTERALWTELWRGPDGDGWTFVPLDGEPVGLRAHFAAYGGPLRLAMLLHDVAKPATRSVEPDGRTRFFGHAELGAAMAADRLRRWRLPNAVVERVSLLIDEHLRPGMVASPGEPPTPRALHRFHRALGDATPDLGWLFLADSLATVGPERLLPRWPAYVGHVRRIVTWTPPATRRMVRRLVDGHAVMRATGLPPGPAVGQVLAAIDEAAAEGVVTDEADALALARRMAARLEDARG